VRSTVGLDHEAVEVLSVTLRATDSAGLAVDQHRSVGVSDVDEPPVLALIGPRSVAEGSALSILAQASDPEGESVLLGVEPLPPGAFWDGNVLRWTPATPRRAPTRS